MNQTVTVSSKTIEAILDKLDQLTKEVKEIKVRLSSEPPYGSDAWWEWSERRADEDIKAGRVIGPFTNAKELLKALH